MGLLASQGNSILRPGKTPLEGTTMKLPSLRTAAALAAAVFAAASPAAAHGQVNYETLYFDQDGQLIGAHITYCDGHVVFWGDMTQLPHEFNWYGCD